MVKLIPETFRIPVLKSEIVVSTSDTKHRRDPSVQVRPYNRHDNLNLSIQKHMTTICQSLYSPKISTFQWLYFDLLKKEFQCYEVNLSKKNNKLFILLTVQKMMEFKFWLQNTVHRGWWHIQNERSIHVQCMEDSTEGSNTHHITMFWIRDEQLLRSILYHFFCNFSSMEHR